MKKAWRSLERCRSEGPYHGGGVLFFRKRSDGRRSIILFRRVRGRGAGLYSIPGGGMEPDDGGDFRSCAIRETWEETGVMVETADIRRTLRISLPCFRWHTLLVEFKGSLSDFRCQPYELTEPREVTLRQAWRLPLTDSMRITLIWLWFRL